MSEYREWFIALFAAIVSGYATKMTGKKDHRSSEQSLIDKLFKEIERIDKDNEEMRIENKEVSLRLDNIERENRTLKEQVVVLTKERDELVDIVVLRDDTILELKNVITSKVP